MKWNLIFLAFTFSASNLIAQKPNGENDGMQTPAGTSEVWLSCDTKGIIDSEYYISCCEANDSLYCHNRQNNYYASLHGSGFVLQSKVNSRKSINFNLKGIYGNGILNLPPNIVCHEFKNKNTLVFWHEGFKEEYINTSAGLRQNFIIEQDLHADQLEVLLNVTGAQLSYGRGNSVLLKTEDGIKFHYCDLNVWDANGLNLNAHIKLHGNNQITIVIDNAKNARYPITIDPITRTVADWQVVGNQAVEYMGVSVAGAGDVNGDGFADVIVGVCLYENGQTNEGAAFVYHGSANGLSTTPALIIEGNKTNLYLGTMVSSAGDVNNDGYGDIIIGLPSDSISQPYDGGALIFLGSPNGIDTSSVIKLSINQSGTRFGVCASSAGDVNGDGYDDVIVGAWLYSNGQFREGAAFVYQGSATGILPIPLWQVESNQVEARMGFGVSGAGDINGDGYSDVIVGAGGFDNNFVDEGAFFIYYGSASGLSPTAAKQINGNQTEAYFGLYVASAGDVNGDGFSDVIVSSPFFDNGQYNEGAAFVYHGSQNGIGSTASFVFEANNNFAEVRSATSAGDFNGDGYADVIIGAPGFNASSNLEGMSFVCYGSTTGLITTIIDTLESNQGGSLFGWSVASAGDVNGDSYSDVIVGAYHYDKSQIEPDAGSAFVYHGMSNGLLIHNVGELKNCRILVERMSSSLIIQMNDGKDANIQVSIVDMLGRKVILNNYTTSSKFLSIPLTLPSGIYLVTIKDLNVGHSYSQKINW